MAKRHLPPPRKLRKILDYIPETGRLYWRAHDAAYGDWVGQEAFTSVSNGYMSGTVDGIRISAHRAAWAIYYGEWPDLDLDHIDGDRSNNRIRNLRQVTPRENNRNRALCRRNKSGVIGVYQDRGSGKWLARIGVDGRSVYLGSFERKEDAALARKIAEAQCGFHRNHGRKREMA